MTSQKENKEETEMKALCIMCMKRQGDPKNGGLCHVCAPPLKAEAGVRAYVRRLFRLEG